MKTAMEFSTVVVAKQREWLQVSEEWLQVVIADLKEEYERICHIAWE